MSGKCREWLANHPCSFPFLQNVIHCQSWRNSFAKSQPRQALYCGHVSAWKPLQARALLAAHGGHLTDV